MICKQQFIGNLETMVDGFNFFLDQQSSFLSRDQFIETFRHTNYPNLQPRIYVQHAFNDSSLSIAVAIINEKTTSATGYLLTGEAIKADCVLNIVTMSILRLFKKNTYLEHLEILIHVCSMLNKAISTLDIYKHSTSDFYYLNDLNYIERIMKYQRSLLRCKTLHLASKRWS